MMHKMEPDEWDRVIQVNLPDEVARLVEFLADPDSAYITGQVYSVNGGLAM
jgi:NAD(P)-dependent dehydrogenase (short-subunit alcohol dehydrogenase family)